MATIKTGVLLKTRGSVGGVNFYDRLGVQCLRNKPQRAANYVSSPAQAYQQSVFKLVADYMKSSLSVAMLIRGGWGMKKNGKGRTGFNNFSSLVLKLLSRDAAGAKVDQSTYEANVASFSSNPGAWMHTNAPLTMSKYPTLVAVDSVTLDTSSGSATGKIEVEKEVFDSWLRENARQYGVVSSPNDVRMLVGGAILGSTATVWFEEVTPTVTGTKYEFTLPSGIDDTAASADIAFAFYPANSGDYGKPSEPAVTQYTRIAVTA